MNIFWFLEDPPIDRKQMHQCCPLCNAITLFNQGNLAKSVAIGNIKFVIL